jgi:hypothetical protein
MSWREADVPVVTFNLAATDFDVPPEDATPPVSFSRRESFFPAAAAPVAVGPVTAAPLHAEAAQSAPAFDYSETSGCNRAEIPAADPAAVCSTTAPTAAAAAAAAASAASAASASPPTAAAPQRAPTTAPTTAPAPKSAAALPSSSPPPPSAGPLLDRQGLPSGYLERWDALRRAWRRRFVAVAPDASASSSSSSSSSSSGGGGGGGGKEGHQGQDHFSWLMDR